MELRPYQIEAKNKVYNAFKRGVQSVLLQCPTGGGKTVIFSSIIHDGQKYNEISKKKRTLVLAHRTELIEQAQNKLFYEFMIHSGVIKSGYPANYMIRSQVGSVQTVVNRKLPYPTDLCIMDEGHHAQEDNTYGTIKEMLLEANPNCKFLAVTATPCRTNGSGFEKIFDELIMGPSVSELIRLGNLVPPKYYISPLDLGKIKVTAGDYNQRELSEVYQSKVHPSDLVDNWKKLANGLQTIGFAVDIAHSIAIIDEFRRQGIKAAHIDGTTPDNIRKRTIKQFESKEIQVLYNVGIFDEGFDMPAIECVQLARPTKSLIKFMQMVGRALRPAEGKEYAIVLDHAGLVAEHDIVERDREWTLEGVTKTSSQTKTMFKDKESGKIYEPKQLPLDIPIQNIELVALNINDLSKEDAGTLQYRYDELRKVANARNFKDFWVWYQLARDVKLKSKSMARHRLMDRANIFCHNMGYRGNFATKIVDDYIEKNTVSFPNP